MTRVRHVRRRAVIRVALENFLGRGSFFICRNCMTGGGRGMLSCKGKVVKNFLQPEGIFYNFVTKSCGEIYKCVLS